ncbi:dTMP kinase [Patescibacteria group bacterium]|nr:dTMP kinase [Patescibacteria group bacterium]MCL5798431.1 dTMP kinase [Patescibacteria group bacterium]
MKGFFITFEGIEGSGKSTQVGLLGSRLKEEGYDIVVTREPGGTRIGEEIRSITHGRENVDLTAVTEAYLMAASRAQHVREIIKPSLSEGKIVVCDRYIDSSLAYQGYGRQLGEKEILELNKAALEGVMPDLTILLDVSCETGFARRNGTDKIDRLDLQQKDFYERVYRGYHLLAKKFSDRYFVVDSSKEIEIVEGLIWERVEGKVGKNPKLR